MNVLGDFFQSLKSHNQSILILDKHIPMDKYCSIDLSIENLDLSRFDISDPVDCQRYIDMVLHTKNAKVAFGGYLEKRDLYSKSERFDQGDTRNIHLGMDFWCEAGTNVLAPIKGKVHSFKNNSDLGNYGPTLVLEHEMKDFTFYTLYGHLSLESLAKYSQGKIFESGDVLGSLGTIDINVGYAPHLHFQIIYDLQGQEGDYFGVCAEKDLHFYKNNCPDPNLLLKL